MKFHAIFAAALAGMAVPPSAHAGEASPLDAVIGQLRAGGNVIIMRHATSPSGQKAPIGMTEGCTLAPGRGLSPQGFFEARAVAEWFAENGVRIDKTYTSDLCRSWDTARLVAAAGNGPVIPREEMKSDDPDVAEDFNKALRAELAATPGVNILLVSHSNIIPLYGAGPLAGEDEAPSGRIHVARSIERADGGDEIWSVVRIDMNADVATRPTLAN